MSSDIKKTSKTMCKYEVAALCNVSMSTLLKWTRMYSDDLLKLGYNKNQKKFTPAQLKYLDSKLDFLEILNP